MSRRVEFESVAHAFSGQYGVDEKPMLQHLVNWKPDQLTNFRKETHCIFVRDERAFEKWEDIRMQILEKEYMRFWNAVVQWTTHPWERDARLAKKALDDGVESYGLLIELACTRTSDELLGARNAYQSLFGESMEEDVAALVKGSQRKLLVGLVSAYRYEERRHSDDSRLELITSEAEMLHKAITERNKTLIEDDETIRILTTRSKIHLNRIKKVYKEKFNKDKNIEEELSDDSLKDTINCLCAPEKYFSKVLNGALKAGALKAWTWNKADERAKEALTRVIVTRADVDLKKIAEEYKNSYKVSLTQKINEVALGNYKDFLVTLASRGG